MAVIVSACLLGENCKYSGGNNRCQAVIDYVQGREVIPVCPEVLGGLSIPRPAAEIVDGVVMNREGVNVDEAFRRGAELALEKASGKTIELAILQPRSPSCGSRQVYDGTFSSHLVDGMGVFARRLQEKGIPMIDADQLGLLK